MKSKRIADSRPWAVAPYWQVERQTKPQTLTGDVECDVAIVGGGIAGLSIASRLSEKSKVVVLEQGRIGEGSTGWSAGIISMATTVDLSVVEEQFGVNRARLLLTRLRQSLQATVETHPGEDIWQSGSSLYMSARPAHRQRLETELQTRARYNLASTRRTNADIPHLTGFHDGLELIGEYAVHPVRLLLSMLDRVTAAGSFVYENSMVTGYKKEGERFVVMAGRHSIRARHLILCTGMKVFDGQRFDSIDRLLLPGIGYLFVTEPSERVKDIVKNSGHIAMWDTQKFGYTYLRYLSDGRILAGGAENPGVVPGTVLSFDDQSILDLHEKISTLHTFPIPPVRYAWRASLAFPADGLPLLSNRSFGDSKLIAAATDGLPSAFLLASCIEEIMASGSSVLEPLLSPERPKGLDARIVSFLPKRPRWIRQVVFRIGFAFMKLRDIFS